MFTYNQAKKKWDKDEFSWEMVRSYKSWKNQKVIIVESQGNP